MKKNIISLLFLVTLSVNAQWTKFAEVTLISKSKDTLHGYGKLLAFKFAFKSLDGKTKNYKYEEINKLIFCIYTDKNKTVKENIVLFKLDIEKISTTLFQPIYTMAEIIYESDRLKIYGVRCVSGFALPAPISKKENFKKTNTDGYTDFYCQIKGEEKMRVIYESINFFKTFKITASDCFKDCIELSKKIQNKELTIFNLNEIGDFYTTKCK